MDKDTENSLVLVLTYLFREEQKHWDELGRPEIHIYNDVVRVAQWFIEQKASENYKP